VRNGGGGGGSSSRGQSFGGAKMDVPLQKQLQGKGQIAALRNNRNLKGISADEALRKTPNELLEMYKAGEITAKTLKLLKKPFEGRMFTKK